MKPHTPRIGIMAAITSILGLGGWGAGSAREIPRPLPYPHDPEPHHRQPVTTHRSKKRKNPMHGICGAESTRLTRHAGLSLDTRRRHNEERRAKAWRELGRIIAARQEAASI